MIPVILFIILGLLAGCLSGLIGIGGGVIIVPILVYLFGLSQLQAQGTTLALLLPPVGFFATWQYYKQGYVDLRITALIAIGFIVGSIFGSKIALTLPTRILTKIFGGILLVVAAKMLLSK